MSRPILRGWFGTPVLLCLLSCCWVGCWLVGCQADDRGALLPLMETDLSRFSPQIQQQLSGERANVEALMAGSDSNGSVSNEELARAWGELGRLYHAYSLHPPAILSYRNASTLDPDAPLWNYLQGVLEQTDGELDAATASLEEARRRFSGSPAMETELGQEGETFEKAAVALDVRLASVYSDLNEHDRALDLLQDLLQRDETVAAAHFRLGGLASSRGDTEAAIEHFERTLELQPQAKTVHYVLGVAYRRMGDAAKAQSHIDAMGAVEPSFPDPWVDALEHLVLGIGPHLDRGQRAVEGGKYEEAEREYRAALGIEPENTTALRGLAYTFRKAGQLDASIQALRGMLAIYPQETAAHLELATTLLEKGDLVAASDEFEALLENDPTFELGYLNLGVVRSRQGRWEDAMSFFHKVLELDPKDRKARFHLAVTLDTLGRPEESLAGLRELALEYPRWIEVRQRLGLEWLKRGELEAAEQEHLAVLGDSEAPVEEKALAHYQLAQISERRDDLGGALENYGQARQLFPGLWQAALSYGNTLRLAERFAEAANEYRSLVEMEPQNVGYRQFEIQALMQAKDFIGAARRLEEGLRQLPRAAELGHLKARLLAISPEAQLRNGTLAYDMADQIFRAFPSIEHAETVAMALAEQGRFGEALNWQQQVIEQAEGEKRQDLLPRLKRNFERYRRGEPVREW